MATRTHQAGFDKTNKQTNNSLYGIFLHVHLRSKNVKVLAYQANKIHTIMYISHQRR